MRISRPTRKLALFTAALAGGAAIGCSNGSERPPSLETAASTSTPGDSTVSVPGDSMASVPNTRVVAEKPETSVTAQPKHKPVGHPVRLPKAGATRTVPPPPAPDTASSPAEPETGQEKWLSYDATSNTVTFELIAGPFTFNGYRNGEATLVVPPKANIVMNFVNKDGTPHSAIVTPGDEPVPNSASTPAIPRAYTIQVLQGLPQEGTDVMRFPVPESGMYRIFCGVPGHGLSGMWIWMKIDPAAKAPSFGPTKP